MVKQKFKQLIKAKKQVIIAEISPPKNSDGNIVRTIAKKFKNKVNAIGISNNRDSVAMSPYAAASFVLDEGIEPIIHIITRDCNRIALISDFLGAQGMGVENFLCTSGDHQTLGNFKAAKNVFDIDSIQLLQLLTNLSSNASILGEQKISCDKDFILGAVAAPYADPLDLQINRLNKKIKAGANFLITHPVYDINRFMTWWQEVEKHKINEKCVIIAGIHILTSSDEVQVYKDKHPSPYISNEIVKRFENISDINDQKSEGIKLAVETIKNLSKIKNIGGFEISCDNDYDTIIEVINQSDLRIN